jgi:uncharacterized protein (TIGR02118 family)
MIKVSVMYPNGEGCTFELVYYCNSHIPMVRRLLGATIKGVAVERGIVGGAPEAPTPYLAMGHLLFESLDAFRSAFGPHAREIMPDIPTHTNTQPTIQISEVVL